MLGSYLKGIIYSTDWTLLVLPSMISLSFSSKISLSLSLYLIFHLSFSSMGSNFHYSIDLNEEQNHHEQPFFYPLGSSSSLLHNQVLSNSSCSSSSISSLSSYLPFFINSQEDQHVAYKNTYHVDHVHLSQPLKVYTHTPHI